LASASAPAPTKPTTSSASWTIVLPTSREFLRRGDVGTAVRKLQLKLRAHHQTAVVADGAFGAVTQHAVTLLERTFHQAATGVAGVPFLRKVGLTVKLAQSAAVTTTTASVSVPRTNYLRGFPLVGTGAIPYSTSLYPYSDVFGKAGPEGPIPGAQLPAALGTPVVAVCNAEVISMTRTATGLGGIWIWLQDVTGTQYYYAHLNSIAAGIAPGTQLSTGQVLGSVGNSGDAAGGAPYLSLEVHPGGGVAIDPFPDLNLLDPTPTRA
jgi:murein DD-endopeptidase MepM/ murein hydrolase activator NlpD